MVLSSFREALLPQLILSRNGLPDCIGFLSNHCDLLKEERKKRRKVWEEGRDRGRKEQREEGQVNSS